MYGQVIDSRTFSPVTRGTLTWTVSPVGGGAPITLTTALTNMTDGSCYRLRVPFETLLGSTTVSIDSLVTSASGSNYDRSRVFLNGTNVATISRPASTTFSFKAADRAVVQRVDLVVSLPAGQSGQIISGTTDSDGDGVNDGDEQLAGTDLNDAHDYLHFTSIRQQADGVVELNWSAVSGHNYTVLKAVDLSTLNFLPIRVHVPGLAPVATLIDTNAAGSGPYFYRVLAE